MGKNVVWGKEENEGYDSSIRSSIRRKAKMLKENSHQEHGLLVSGQTRYILREIYSRPIQRRNQDTQQYARYAFVSEYHCSPSGNDIICNNCDGIKKAIRRLCRVIYEQDNKVIHNKSNTSTLVDASASKAIQKIEMVVGKLRSVQKINNYLKSRLEEQREKDGIMMATDKSCDLFDDEAEVDIKKVLYSNGELTAGKEILSRTLWNQSVHATRDAKEKGKK